MFCYEKDYKLFPDDIKAYVIETINSILRSLDNSLAIGNNYWIICQSTVFTGI